MQKLILNILNPKVIKILTGLADLGLISINDERHQSSKWYDDKEFVQSLQEDVELYKEGKLKTHTKEEVFDMISKKMKTSAKEKTTKKSIKESGELNLIPFVANNKYPQQLLDALDKEYEDYQNGVGRNFTKKAVFSAIRKKKTI